MAKKTSKTPRGKARLRAEIVEGAQALHRLGAMSDHDLAKTTMRMLGRDAVPKVPPLTPRQIIAMREDAGISQAVLAAFLNVAVKTVSQWERGERVPTGAALKLLHVVKQKGVGAITLEHA